MKKMIVNCETNETVIVEMTSDEILQLELDQEEIKKETTDALNAANAKASAEAKLQALGLTADDLKALGL
jgi:hypothetical protein